METNRDLLLPGLDQAIKEKEQEEVEKRMDEIQDQEYRWGEKE